VLAASAREQQPMEEALRQAERLIYDEAVRRNELVPSPTSGYGSAWWIEFPRAVALILEEQGITRAAEYVTWTFEHGTEDAFDRIRRGKDDPFPQLDLSRAGAGRKREESTEDINPWAPVTTTDSRGDSRNL
jgi:hypothetical protein